MRKLFLWLSVLIVTVSSPSVFAVSLHSRINKLLRHYPHLNIGIKVVSLHNGHLLYEKNSHRHFVPASNLKLFTALAALSYLGPNYTFKTSIYADADNLVKGTLKGNLYLKFTGDPSLTKESMTQMIRQVAQRGIQRIQGSVYLDNEAFDQNNVGRGWMADDLNFCFAAPSSAIIVNENCAYFSVKTPQHSDGLAWVNRKTDFIHVTSHAKALAQESEFCPLDLDSDPLNNYRLSGCMARLRSEKTFEVALKNPSLYMQQLVAESLRQQGIHLTGHVVIGAIKTRT